MGDRTRASRGMNQQSYSLPTVAGMIEGDIIAYISLVTAMSPWIQLAYWLQLLAVQVIIMIDISIETVAKDS